MLADDGSAEKPKKRRGCRRCLKWLLILFIVLLVIVGILAFFLYRVPERLGILPNAAERELMETPDRNGAEELLAEASARGFNPTGASVYVFPYKESEGSVVFLLLDGSKGFAFNRTSKNPVADTFVQIAGGAKAEELAVQYVGMTYVSPKGRELMRFAASRSDILRYASGAITQEQFVATIAGDFNYPAMMGEQVDSMKEMLQ